MKAQTLQTTVLFVSLSFSAFIVQLGCDRRVEPSANSIASQAPVQHLSQKENVAETLGQTGLPKRTTPAARHTLKSFQIPHDWSANDQRLFDFLRSWKGDAEIDCQDCDTQKVVSVISEIAERHDADAMAVLGLLYSCGRLVTADEDKAVRLLDTAAEQGSMLALHKVNCDRVYSKLPDEDRIKALEQITKLGDSGYEPSQEFLARNYFLGLVVARDAMQSMNWSLKVLQSNPKNEAARNVLIGSLNSATPTEEQRIALSSVLEQIASTNTPSAIHDVGTFYADGLGVSKDVQKASDCFQKAMEARFAPAFTSMGKLLRDKNTEDYRNKRVSLEESLKNRDLCLELFRIAMQLGDERAKFWYEFTAPSEAEKRIGAVDYSPASMSLRASQDALMNASGYVRAQP